MRIDFNQVVPIYIQIADAIEDDILSGVLKEGDKCYSQVTLAKELSINPATAAKGIRLLVERGLLDKNRGQAMTIKKGAIEIIKRRKMESVLQEQIISLVNEAKKLGIEKNELIKKLNDIYD